MFVKNKKLAVKKAIAIVYSLKLSIKHYCSNPKASYFIGCAAIYVWVFIAYTILLNRYHVNWNDITNLCDYQLQLLIHKAEYAFTQYMYDWYKGEGIIFPNGRLRVRIRSIEKKELANFVLLHKFPRTSCCFRIHPILKQCYCYESATIWYTDHQYSAQYSEIINNLQEIHLMFCNDAVRSCGTWRKGPG